MPAWVRNGLLLGICAAVTTAIMNGLAAINRPADICQPNSPLFSALGLLLFLALAAIAGWRTTRSGEALSDAALSGLLVGAVSGVVVIVVVLISLGNAERAAACIKTTSNTSPAAAAGVLRFAAVVLGIVLALLGLGVGAAVAALAGLVGQRRSG